MTTTMIPKTEWAHLVPDTVGEQVNTFHCKEGAGNDKFYIKRIPNGAVAFCHHCRKHGYASLYFLANGEKAAGTRQLGRFTGSSSRSGESEYFPNRETDSVEVTETGTGSTATRVLPDRRLTLPPDSEALVSRWDSTDAKIWILKHIGAKESQDNGIVYSKKLSSIVFPRYLDGTLVSYQSRRFPKGEPKYLTVGKSISDSINNSSIFDRIVLVEDMVSAIKLSYIVPAFPLSGVGISDEQLAHLLQHYKKFAVMLDNDNWQVRMAQIKLLRKLSSFGSATIIHVEKDPKEYSLYELTNLTAGFTGAP